MTFSSDGTSHKNIQFLSRHATILPQDDNPPVDFFLGVTPEINHTTNTQFNGWKQTIRDLCENYNESPIGNAVPADPTKLWEKLRGFLSDHASDQRKLSGMLEKFHEECDREL